MSEDEPSDEELAKIDVVDLHEMLVKNGNSPTAASDYINLYMLQTPGACLVPLTVNGHKTSGIVALDKDKANLLFIVPIPGLVIEHATEGRAHEIGNLTSEQKNKLT